MDGFGIYIMVLTAVLILSIAAFFIASTLEIRFQSKSQKEKDELEIKRQKLYLKDLKRALKKSKKKK